MRGLHEVAVGVDLRGEVVGARPKSGVGEDVIDMPVQVLGFAEKGVERGPVGYVGLDEGVYARGGRCWGVYVAVDDRCTVGEEEIYGGEADA